jgi:hypothetical protein
MDPLSYSFSQGGSRQTQFSSFPSHMQMEQSPNALLPALYNLRSYYSYRCFAQRHATSLNPSSAWADNPMQTAVQKPSDPLVTSETSTTLLQLRVTDTPLDLPSKFRSHFAHCHLEFYLLHHHPTQYLKHNLTHNQGACIECSKFIQ